MNAGKAAVILGLSVSVCASCNHQLSISSQPYAGSRQVSGRVAVIDGRTLWFAQHRLRVRLDGIDTCEVPQWSFGARLQPNPGAELDPVPCGAFAKAWLKRLIGNGDVVCVGRQIGGEFEARCRTAGRDLSGELLGAGLARVTPGIRPSAKDGAAEARAVTARYGLWGVYVLNMDEWRERAIDRTTGRRPIADYNLLRDRRSEISPPFAEARRWPPRTDR